MPVLFDTDILSLLLYPDAGVPPHDPATGQPVVDAPGRVAQLVDTLELAKTRILIPTPVLAEFLVIAEEAGPAYLAEIENRSVFRVIDYDQRAAIETARLEVIARTKGDKREGAVGAWQKIKIDRQIIAIAKVQGAECIYSDDGDVIQLAERASIPTMRVSALPLPAPEQTSLPLEAQATELPSSTAPEPPSALSAGDEPPKA